MVSEGGGRGSVGRGRPGGLIDGAANRGESSRRRREVYGDGVTLRLRGHRHRYTAAGHASDRLLCDAHTVPEEEGGTEV